MKPRLQTSLGQHLVLTPQLRQAIHMLQLSAPELEAEIAQAVESNPLLEWEEPEPLSALGNSESSAPPAAAGEEPERASTQEFHAGDGAWEGEDGWEVRHMGAGGGGGDEDGNADAAEWATREETLQEHLQWQLRLSPLSPRDQQIGLTLIDALDEDGYLREPLDSVQQALLPEIDADESEILVVLHQLQRFDPVGVGARDLSECLRLQLAPLPDDTPGKTHAIAIIDGPMERVPRIGVEGLAAELRCTVDQAGIAMQLLRSLDPRPGAQLGGLPTDTYVTPDCVIWRQNGVWRVALAAGHQPRLTIHRAYEAMADSASAADASYLRGRLQEARWLIKSIESRADTLLKVVRCLTRQQSGFLEFGPEALRPLTLREVADEVGLHESTVSRAIARKYARTPRGTLALRSFFASGVETDAGGEASSTAVQAMIRKLVEAEDPRKPLSDARLTETLKASGVQVARRTVAKYREAMNIPSSHERVRLG